MHIKSTILLLPAAYVVLRECTVFTGQGGTYLPDDGGGGGTCVPTLDEGEVPTLDRGSTLDRGGVYLGCLDVGYLPWTGGGVYLPWMQLPWTGG